MGYVYILVNSSMPDLIKIGETDKEPCERARELYGTGVPTPFEVVYALSSDAYKLLEAEIHSALNAYRVNPDREFFNCPVDIAIKKLNDLNAEYQVSEDGFFQTLDWEIRDPDTRNVAVLKLFSYLTNHPNSLSEMLPLLVYVVESQDWHNKDYAKKRSIEWLKKAQDPRARQALRKYDKVLFKERCFTGC